MDIKGLTVKVKDALCKYKYAVVILLIGVGLLLLPKKSTAAPVTNTTPVNREQTLETEDLTEILKSVQGAGKVKVLLSVGTGEQTIYQTNSENTVNGDINSIRSDTVIIADAQRTEAGLVTQVNPPKYLGAIVVCEGADSPAVKLAVTQAVAKITGLGADNICVLKME